MGLIVFIGINWLLIGMVIAIVRKPSGLIAVAHSWRKNPWMNTFLLVWITSILIAGWGVLSGGHFSWPISTPWGKMQSWKLGGLLSFAGLGVLFVASVIENHRHRKRSETPPNQPK